MEMKNKESDDVREEEEEENRKKIWDCGSPLYDSYELVAISNVIERHFMILPYLSGSRKVTAHHQPCRLNSSAPPKPVEDLAAVGGSGGGGGKYSGVSFLIDMLERLAVWKRKMDTEKQQKTGVVSELFNCMKQELVRKRKC